MKKRFIGLGALLLCLVFCLSLLPGAALAAQTEKNTLTVGVDSISGKLNPFFITTSDESDIVNLTQGSLLAADRGGAVICHGIDGETVPYGGAEYTYYGLGDLDIQLREDGSVDYTLRMRDDIRFADGVPATVDDVIFSLYVCLDPAYDGNAMLYNLPIEGVDEYRSGMETLLDLLLAAGRDNEDFTLWDAETQAAFWADLDRAGVAFAQSIIDYCVANYADDLGQDYVGATGDEIRADPALQVKLGMAAWGYAGSWFEGAAAEDYYNVLLRAYSGDVRSMSNAESAGTSLFDLMEKNYSVGIQTGTGASNISGIRRVDDYTLCLHMTEYRVNDLYALSLLVAPLHYYGDAALYDFAANRFGFPKGDLSSVRARAGEPLGCGPYSFDHLEGTDVVLRANPYYFRGKPRIEYLRYTEAMGPEAVAEGRADIVASSLSVEGVNAIKELNGGSLSGSVIETRRTDYRGYGYIGANADLLNVGGDPASEASKALRKGFMTVLAVFREETIEAYYGDMAELIEYPISKTSWAYPQPGSPDYRAAYSADAEGQPIYTEAMSREQRVAAAKAAAIGYFKAAGFAYDESLGRFTGVDEEYEILIPGGGYGDHPAYQVAVRAAELLAELGVTLRVTDLGGMEWSDALWNNTAMMWAAAWQSAVDPDMTQVYHSQNAHGNGSNANHYSIDDPALDALIVRGFNETSVETRKAIYKQAMELVMDWGVELPLYQRQDATIFSSQRVDIDTLTPDMTVYWTWLAEVEKLALRDMLETPVGDANEDGVLNRADAADIFAAVSAGGPVTSGRGLMDVNLDGTINNRDALLAFRAFLGGSGE